MFIWAWMQFAVGPAARTHTQNENRGMVIKKLQLPTELTSRSFTRATGRISTFVLTQAVCLCAAWQNLPLNYLQSWESSLKSGHVGKLKPESNCEANTDFISWNNKMPRYQAALVRRPKGLFREMTESLFNSGATIAALTAELTLPQAEPVPTWRWRFLQSSPATSGWSSSALLPHWPTCRQTHTDLITIKNSLLSLENHQETNKSWKGNATYLVPHVNTHRGGSRLTQLRFTAPEKKKKDVTATDPSLIWEFLIAKKNVTFLFFRKSAFTEHHRHHPEKKPSCLHV